MVSESGQLSLKKCKINLEKKEEVENSVENGNKFHKNN